MNILIVAATVFEIQPAIDHFERYRFETGQPGPEVLITGVGAVAATYHLTTYLTTNTPELIIQAGIAGSFRREITLGTVFFVEEESFGDMGVVEAGEFKDLFDLGLLHSNDLPFIQKRLKNPFAKLLETSHLPSAKSIGINEITTSPHRIEAVLKKYDPDIESMEGAPFHYVCLQEKLRFLQLRSVSNYVGERDKSRWDFKAAISNLNEHLLQIISLNS